MRKLFIFYTTLLALCAFTTTFAQNLESIGKEKPVKVTGGVALNQIFYKASGIQQRRSPYTYYASGNVNLSLYGWSVPLSFSFSNQQTTFQQPFNQYSMHPTYKWVTAHVGYTSMSFSPYTVNGHIFLGAAVDLAPEGKWKMSALYGRFLKAVEPDTINTSAATPSFKRMGYGFKTGYNNNGSTVDLILFHAQDQLNSIRYVPDSLGILPQENLVVSIGAGQTFLEHFTLKAELASSAITRDIRATEESAPHPLAKTGFLYTARASSAYYKAFKSSFNYQFSAYTIGVGYERIDPQYRTLGAYYFNNDLESITVNGASAILQGRMNIAASAGTQHDNLDKSKVSTMRRLVGSLNVNYAASQKLNFSASYSTFQTYTNIRSQFVNINRLTPYDNLDTLNYVQISKNATLTAMYAVGKSETKRQSVNLNVSFQNAADKQGAQATNKGSQFYNINTAYGLSLIPQSMVFSLAFNATLNEGEGYNTKTLGPTTSVSKSFFNKKFRTTLSSSYNNTYMNAQRINTILNGRINGSLSIKKKHNLNVSLVAVSRKSETETNAKSFKEFTGTLGYSYAFGLK